MKESVKGIRVIHEYRLYSERASENAKRVALTTETTESISVSADSTATKDGAIRNAGTPEIELENTSILAVGDPMIDKLKQAQLNGELIEAWVINLDEKGTGADSSKYKSTYYQGYITDYEKSAPADDNVEISLTIGCNGKGADGYATVDDATIEEAMYVFADTTEAAA